ncbi:MAG: triose-phosphate isomerase [Patescibacteria group bacterium]|jgi:triosephosphate isomerase|nr:triose-phosphate isomerase [Patescibacteria group bacterium]
MSKTIIANWKMNLSIKESLILANKIAKIKTDNEIIVCPDFLSLNLINQKLKRKDIYLGAQDCAAYSYGSYTGEVASQSIIESGAKYVIIGHSERRKYQKEDNEIINNKIKQALKVGLKVILCVGENLTEKKNKKTKSILKTQLKGALKDVLKKELTNISIAYEPIWAIGSGKTPEAEKVNETSIYIKDLIYNDFKKKVKVFYGGSIKASNSSEFLKYKQIDGLLIGGASLNYQEFSKIFKKNYVR